MKRKGSASRKWLLILQPILLAFLLLLIILLVLAGSEQSAVVNADEGREYLNLFEYRMCLARDSNWCSNGDNFQTTLFRQMYLNPDLGANPDYFWDYEGVRVPHYPTSTTGALTRYTVDLCEAGTPTLDGHCPAAYDYDVIRCLDGTRPLFYFEPGQGAQANKWLFKIQGGGDACVDSCPAQSIGASRRDFSSAYGENESKRNGRGIYSNNADNLFRNYNVVMLDKCFGDRNLGDTTYTDVFTGLAGLEAGTGPVYFHGFRIILATLRRLNREFNLGDAEEIVFLTQSNGTNGVYHYIDRLSGHISSTLGLTAPVYLVAQSFLLPGPEIEYYFENDGQWPAHYTDIPTSTAAPGIINAPHTLSFGQDGACGPGFDPGNPAYSDWLLAGMKVDGPLTCDPSDPIYAEAGAHSAEYATEDFASGLEAHNFAVWGVDHGPTVTWDESCVAAHAADPDLRACRDARHVLSHHLQTPTFFAAQASDRNLRTINFGLSYWTAANIWWPEDMQQRVELLAEVISGYQPRSDCADEKLGRHGFFIDNTVDHMALTEMSKLARQMRANSGLEAGFNFQLQQYLMYWLQPTAPTVQCLDSNALYDTEFASPVEIEGWPELVQCQTGYYSGGSQPYQSCDDPGFGDPTDPTLNKADSRWVCQGPPILNHHYLPLVIKE